MEQVFPDKLIALICAYNEEKYIKPVVEETLKYVPEVVVVDDCSVDNTPEEVKKTKARYIRHDVNTGKGGALQTGFRFCIENGYDGLITLDGDGQHDPSEIPNLLKALKDYDIVIGTRNKFGTNMPLIRKFTNFACSLLVSILSFTWIEDSQSGYRAIKIKVLKHIKLVSERYNLESELLIRAARNRYAIGSVPVKTIYGDETSKMDPVKDPIRFILLVFRSLFWW
jgi:glycosyltransferase involved in cell wall biosynthesis